MPVQPLRPWTHALREWQQDFYEQYTSALPRDCLLVAVPSAGKTTATCRIMHSHLLSGAATHIIVICPSVHLMAQWIEAAHEKGAIQLCPLEPRTMVEGHYPDDFHGHVTTYQTLQGKIGQLALAALLHKHQGQLLVVVDEVHHAGINLSWGVALENAFERAAFRLFLSGTPFRTDGIPLPFVDYEMNGQCHAFYSYSYTQGLTDKVCRRIVFPKYDGQLEYWNGEEIIRTTFHDDTSEIVARDRLKAAITSDWLDGVILDAHTRLDLCRQNGHRDAGGLIVCMDDFHARKVVERVKALTGTVPTLVTHQEEAAHEKIVTFATSATPWIVAVKMISEGVDLPRLRVGIYATNILTELYFWQFCGRFIRMIPDLVCEQDAFVFIPSDPVLLAYAQKIYQEDTEQLRQVVSDIVEGVETTSCEWTYGPESMDLLRFRSVYGTGTAEQDGAIFLDGVEVSADEYRAVCTLVPAALQSEKALLAAILVWRSLKSSAPDKDSPPEQEPSSNYKRRAIAMQRESELVKAFRLRLLDQGKMTTAEDQRFFSHLQSSLNRLVHVKDKRLCTLAHLHEREQYLHQLIRSGTYVF